MDFTLPSPTLVGTDLYRAALIERVRAARPAIVSVVAPAGFGKSTFVRQLLAGVPATAICDCRGVASDGDLARRVVPALADEAPDRSDGLAQSETMLGDGLVSGAERAGVALAAWRLGRGSSVFVFENAEDAIAEPGARDVLAMLLASRPEERAVVLCSREPIRLQLSRFAPPHRILTVRAADLAFTRDEIAAIVTGADAAPEAVERIAEVSGGWPVAVLLLARFAREGRLDALLDTLGDVAYDELYEYLADQVLGDAPRAAIDGLLACAAIPSATERDLRLALGAEPFAAFAAYAKSSPFVTRRGAAFSVHPLVATMLRERERERTDALLRPAAAAFEHGGEFQRAAEIHLARGHQRAAALALERVELPDADAPPPLAYARVLASLDRAVVLDSPRLWSVTALLRTFTVDSRLLLDEAQAIWERLPADAPPAQRIYVYVFRVLMLSYVGEFETALGLVDDFRARIAAPDVPVTRIHGWLLLLRSLVTARIGRTDDAERDLAAAWPLVSRTGLLAGGALVTLGAEIARVRGDRDTERERIERAIEIGRSMGCGNFTAYYQAEAAFGAWLAGDDDEFARHARALDAAVERDAVRGFAFFAACALERAAEPHAADQPKWIAAGYLIAAANAADTATSLRHAHLARDTACTARSPYCRMLAALALAELNPARRDALRAEAFESAHRIDAPPLHAAVEAVARDERGTFLDAFVQRFRRDGAHPPRSGLTVELVAGRVLRDGQPLALAEREHALLAAIALRPEPISRERLTDLLWPGLPDSAARNAFHVCLHRLKARIGDGTVVRSREGYRLGRDVRVDLWEIDRALATLRTDPRDAPRLEGLRALYERLRLDRPPKFDAWEWFEATERHLREVRCEVAHELAKHALDEGRTHDALALCHEMIAYDPCDEPAREIAIRAYLDDGDRAAALRHFRQYRDVLQAELQCEPSAALAALVGASA